jgi:hypothetical protein
MELEHQHVIKFFADEGMQGVQILSRIRDHYGTEGLSRTQVYDWINEVKRGRTYRVFHPEVSISGLDEQIWLTPKTFIQASQCTLRL